MAPTKYPRHSSLRYDGEGWRAECKVVPGELWVWEDFAKLAGADLSAMGNKYLSWAFVEAANFAKRYDENCRRWYDRKQAKTSTVLATKALACKLAKAAWHIMAKQTDYDATRMFPELASKQK